MTKTIKIPSVSEVYISNLSGSLINSKTATHPRISAFRTTYFEATPPPAQLSFNNNKMLELFINTQLLFLPRKICSLYSLLNSRLQQQFVKEGTSEEDQFEGDSALQDTEQENPSFFQKEST